MNHESRQGWRIGGTVAPVYAEDREALVEYCHVAAARSRLTESGRLLARAAVAGPVPSASGLHVGDRPQAGAATEAHALNA